MKLSQLINKNEILFGEFNFDTEITSLACNLKDVKSGGMFFCFKGTNTDSHTLYKKAEELGAAVIVVEKSVDSKSYIAVRDSRKIMALASKRFHNDAIDKMKLITVTGTNGKTTTTYILESIFKTAGFKTGIIGTCGIKIGDIMQKNDMTTPDPIALHELFEKMFLSGVQVVIMEVSAHSIALKKMSGTCADVGIFTNLTEDHLDFFKTMSSYKKAKFSYFTLPNMLRACVNIDDDLGREIHDKKSLTVSTYGIEKGGDFTVSNVVERSDGIEFILCHNGIMREVKLQLVGLFNVYNALAAAAAAVTLGVDIDTVVKGLEQAGQVDGRFNMFELSKGSLAIIDYAHTPDALENALKSARKLTKSKLICVFGCGGNRDKKKRKIMGEIAGRLSDLTIITSDNPRFEVPEDIISDIEKGMQKDKYYLSIALREKAIEHAIDFAGSGDTIIICGKGHEDYQEIQGVKYHFSDREIVEKFL